MFEVLNNYIPTLQNENLLTVPTSPSETKGETLEEVDEEVEEAPTEEQPPAPAADEGEGDEEKHEEAK